MTDGGRAGPGSRVARAREVRMSEAEDRVGVDPTLDPLSYPGAGSRSPRCC
jgi:hypothetical protein